MNLVFETLRRVADGTAAAWGTSELENSVVMTGFGDSSVTFDVAVWTHQPWRYRVAVSELHEAVWWGLKESGVAIAFPQLDLHLDQDVTEALRGMARGLTGPRSAE